MPPLTIFVTRNPLRKLKLHAYARIASCHPTASAQSRTLDDVPSSYCRHRRPRAYSSETKCTYQRAEDSGCCPVYEYPPWTLFVTTIIPPRLCACVAKFYGHPGLCS